jgi:hypothetical protein
MGMSRCLRWRDMDLAGTRRVHFWTGGHSWGTRDVSRHGLGRNRDARSRPLIGKSSCKQRIGVVRTDAKLTPSFAREEVMAAQDGHVVRTPWRGARVRVAQSRRHPPLSPARRTPGDKLEAMIGAQLGVATIRERAAQASAVRAAWADGRHDANDVTATQTDPSPTASAS